MAVGRGVAQVGGNVNDKQDESQPAVEVGTVQFIGPFRPEEREFLAAQFNRCRFRFLARSALDHRLTLVQWEGAPSGRGGPSPLFSPPARSTYVIDGSGRPGRYGGAAAPPPVRPAGGGMILDRIDGDAELQTRYADHFPTVRLGTPWWDRLRRLFRGTMPALMVAVASTWLLAVAWACGLVR